LTKQPYAAGPRHWLADLITRQVPLDQWEGAYARRPDDIKAVLTFADA